MKKKIIGITAIVVVALLILTAFTALGVNPFEKKKSQESDSYYTKTMKVVTAETGDIRNSISTKGSIASETTMDVKTDAKVKIQEMNVMAGSKVMAGDTLATLDVESLQDEYDRLHKEWIKCKEELGNMKPSYDYVRIVATQNGKVAENNLIKNKNTSDILNDKDYLLLIEADDELMMYASDVPVGKITTIGYASKKGKSVKPGDLLFTVKIENGSFKEKVEKAADLENQLAKIERLIEKPYIVAECDAIVSKVISSTGASVDKGEVIIKYEPTDEFLIKISITKDELQKVALGQDADVTLSSGAKLKGEVSHISYVTNDNGKFDMIIKLKDTANAEENDMLPGLKATVDIVLEEKLGVVKVPIDAIKTDNTGEYVLVYTGNMDDVKNYTVDNVPTEKKYIEKGLVTPLYAEIAEGVSAGDNLVIVTVSKNDNNYYGDMMGY